eukprot:scaffold3686_cov193-Alexandrium_tamarense.AAC.5
MPPSQSINGNTIHNKYLAFYHLRLFVLSLYQAKNHNAPPIPTNKVVMVVRTALELELLLFVGSNVVIASCGAIDGEGVGNFEGRSVGFSVGATVGGEVLNTEKYDRLKSYLGVEVGAGDILGLVEGCSEGAVEILGEEVGLTLNVGEFETVGKADGIAEIVGADDTDGDTDGASEGVGVGRG